MTINNPMLSRSYYFLQIVEVLCQQQTIQSVIFISMQNQNQKIEAHILKKYSVVKKLGSGAYGHVWKVKQVSSAKIFALKKIFDAFQNPTDSQRTYREIAILKQLEHLNVIKLFEVIKSENKKDIYLVFQYMESDVFNVTNDGLLQEVHKKYILYQLLKGLKYIHSAGLIHRDLKPSNLLLNSDCLTKICDFGLVRFVEQSESETPVLTENVATRWYRAPEVLLGSKDYNQMADMWSVGCIAAQIISGKPLFPGNSTTHQVELILSITGRPLNSDIAALKSQIAKGIMDDIKNMKQKDLIDVLGKDNKEAKDFISKLVQVNPGKRMSAEEALKHPYMKDFHNPKDEQDFKGEIKLAVNQNIKLSIDEYRTLIEDLIEGKKSESRDSKTSLQSPKSFSDLRKFSSKKSSKNNSKVSIKPTTPFEYKPALGSKPTIGTNKIGSPQSFKNISRNQTIKSPILTPSKLPQSPSSFKEIISESQKENKQLNGVSKQLNSMLKRQARDQRPISPKISSSKLSFAQCKK